jgi:hypothetical protein
MNLYTNLSKYATTVVTDIHEEHRETVIHTRQKEFSAITDLATHRFYTCY